MVSNHTEYLNLARTTISLLYKGNAMTRLIRYEAFRDYALGEPTTVPTFSFSRPDNDEPWDIDDSGIRSSRWQAQLGFRYIF